MSAPDDAARAAMAETMRRARHNVEVLVAELPRLGYRFERPEAAHRPPEVGIADRLDAFEARADAALPLSLRAFAETVGSVSLRGSHPTWRHPYPDPLEIVVDAEAVDEWEDRLDWHADEDGAEPLEVDLGADHLHKADISGGPPISMEVTGGTDGIVHGEWHGVTLVELLRVAFHQAGFPGWERPPEPEDGGPVPLPDPLRRLAAGLEPL